MQGGKVGARNRRLRKGGGDNKKTHSLTNHETQLIILKEGIALQLCFAASLGEDFHLPHVAIYESI